MHCSCNFSLPLASKWTYQWFLKAVVLNLWNYWSHRQIFQKIGPAKIVYFDQKWMLCTCCLLFKIIFGILTSFPFKIKKKNDGTGNPARRCRLSKFSSATIFTNILNFNGVIAVKLVNYH